MSDLELRPTYGFEITIAPDFVSIEQPYNPEKDRAIILTADEAKKLADMLLEAVCLAKCEPEKETKMEDT